MTRQQVRDAMGVEPDTMLTFDSREVWIFEGQTTRAGKPTYYNLTIRFGPRGVDYRGYFSCPLDASYR